MALNETVSVRISSDAKVAYAIWGDDNGDGGCSAFLRLGARVLHASLSELVVLVRRKFRGRKSLTEGAEHNVMALVVQSLASEQDETLAWQRIGDAYVWVARERLQIWFGSSRAIRGNGSLASFSDAFGCDETAVSTPREFVRWLHQYGMLPLWTFGGDGDVRG